MPSPIVLFVYNRAEHLKKTVEALAANPEAKQSTIYIFSDGAKKKKVPENAYEDEKKRLEVEYDAVNEKNVRKVDDVRNYIDSLPEKNYFAEVIIKKSEGNMGLAKSVISGVDYVIRKHGRVIVVEDDAVSSPQFLEFMNKALDFYESYNKKVWFIGGYCPKLDIPQDYVHDFYLMGRGSSYAWATWLDRWNKIDWDVKSYGDFKWNILQRRAFNKYGKDRANMLDSQMLHKVNSWAIRFSYEMFRQNMYAILPTKSLIQTIGRDGSGTHTTKESHDFDVNLEHSRLNTDFCDVNLDERIVRQHIAFFHRSLPFLVKQYIINVILKKK